MSDQIPERVVKFLDAANALEAEGQKVTYAAVHAKSGGRGSFNDVGIAIKLWREQKRDAVKPEIVRHDLPAAETDAVLALMGQLWAKAEIEAQAVIEKERQALEQLRAEMEDEKAQALEAADATMLANEELTTKLASLETQLETALKAAEELNLKLLKAEAKAEAKADTNQLLEQLLQKLTK
jgi:chromosome segregation ATPase